MSELSKVTFALQDPASLPTHIARVVGRVNLAGPDASADTFLYASYVVESLIKTLSVVLCAGIRRTTPDAVYKFEYDLVRGDGLGSWASVISTCTTQSYAGYVDAELHSLISWLSKKRTREEDAWVREAICECNSIFVALGMPSPEVLRKPNILHLLAEFVRIRNKTKAHGAVGEEFFEKANPLYLSALRRLIDNCPVMKWQWLFLAERPQKGNVKAINLQGPSPTHVPGTEAEGLRPREIGIHFRTHDRGQLFHCGDLLKTGWECKTFLVPNGGYTAKGVAEYIDYADGTVSNIDMPRLIVPPAPLPPSATEGGDSLDIYSNVLGNLPLAPEGYVERPALQEELSARLMDTNHPIITLHGRGGVGKTSLSLYEAHRIAGLDIPKFDHIIW